MKTAKATPAAWYLDCPECGEGVADYQGSLMWTEASPAGQEPSKVATCINGHKVRLPKFLQGSPA